MGEDLNFKEDEEELEYEEEEEYDYEVSLPKVINWVEKNGKSVYGVEMINYDEKKMKMKMKEFIRGELEVCPICFQSWTSNGSHRICCLPCGHIYGMSCIKKWLQQDFRSSPRKCPQCNKLCTLKDVKVLYASRLQAAANHKISTTRFPFTKKGFKVFEQYVLRRETDALVRGFDASKLRAYVWSQNIDFLKRTAKVLANCSDVLRQRDNVLEKRADALEWQAESLEQQAYALELRAKSLERRADALEQQADALEQQAYALDHRADAFRRRANAYKECMRAFEERYKEHMGQTVLMDVALQCEKASNVKDDMRNAYKSCSDISNESRCSIGTFLKEESDKDYAIANSLYGEVGTIEKQLRAQYKCPQERSKMSQECSNYSRNPSTRHQGFI